MRSDRAKALSLKDLTVSKSSYVDPNGFVFYYDKHIYRAIRSGKEVFYRSLFEKGTIARLVEKSSFVESQITDFSVPESDSPLVIHHRAVELESYCVEWSPSMLKDAALLTLDLAIELTQDNCLLQDAYPYVLWYSLRMGCQAGSILKITF